LTWSKSYGKYHIINKSRSLMGGACIPLFLVNFRDRIKVLAPSGVTQLRKKGG